ncbi:MAG: hypothetical protein IT208_09030 [Chthonomonadales bacterium]|nr:hypothetical protein [Chthonomonadales bacterium]
MRGWIVALAALAAALLAAGGCARSSVRTELLPDGVVRRTVELRGTAPAESGHGTIRIGPPASIEDLFAPPSGPAWKVTRSVEGDESVYTAVRTLPAGEPWRGDLVVKAAPPGGEDEAGRAARPAGPEPRIVNEASVRRIAPGRWEYRERLRWVGKRPDMGEMAPGNPELLSALRASLPPALATDADLKAVAGQLMLAAVHVLLGPPDPLIDQMLLNRGLAEARLSRRLGAVVPGVLGRVYGQRLPPAQRVETARRLVGRMLPMSTRTRDTVRGGLEGKAGDSRPAGPAPVALAFTAKLPGRVVETNGQVDALAGTVVWGLYNVAVAPEDVVLRAVCELGAR